MMYYSYDWGCMNGHDSLTKVFHSEIERNLTFHPDDDQLSPHVFGTLLWTGGIGMLGIANSHSLNVEAGKIHFLSRQVVMLS